MTLDELEPGHEAEIIKINCDSETARRLAAMGIKPHRKVVVVRRFHGLQLRIGTTDIVMRSRDAKKILVDRL